MVLASLCPQARSQAITELLSVAGRTVVRYERSGAELTRYAQGHGVAAVAGWLQVLPMDGPVLGSDLRDVVAEDLGRILELLGPTDEVVLVLPEGMDAAVGVAGLEAADRLEMLHSVAVAVDPGSIEDALWRRGSLSEHGTAVCELDLRTEGDFLVTNLLWADTVALVSSSPPPSIGRPIALLSHINPVARIMHLACSRFAWAGFDIREAQARTRPGALALPTELESRDGIVTVLCTATRALHPSRLAERLPEITAGVVFSRGTMWLASAPDRRLAWWGVGPEAGFEDGGAWLEGARPPGSDVPTEQALQWWPGRGDRGTTLAFTGADLDAAELAFLLAECVLDEREQEALDSGALSLPDPFGLAAAASAVPHSTSPTEERNRDEGA